MIYPSRMIPSQYRSVDWAMSQLTFLIGSFPWP